MWERHLDAGACCPTIPPTFLNVIAQIFWVQATVAVVFGSLLSALSSPTAELLSDGIPSAEAAGSSLLAASPAITSSECRALTTGLRPNNRAKLGLDEPIDTDGGPQSPHRRRPLGRCCVTTMMRGAPRKTPTDGGVRLIFSSERRFARIGSPDGRCRREPSRRGATDESRLGNMGGFCSRKAGGWIWKELNFQGPDTRPQGPKKRKSDGRDRAVGHDQHQTGSRANGSFGTDK